MRTLIIITVLLALFFGIFLGSRPLSVPDEGRYVEIPREMVATGDWLTPRLNGVKYFEKPPLFYWFEAVLIKLFGLSEWSVRLGPAFFALLGCLAVWYAGTQLFGSAAGILSAAVLATSTLYYALSRLITLDMPVTVLLTVALLSFLLGTRERAGTGRRMYFYGFYAFSALAVLTKGLIGMVFPAMIIGCWFVVTGEWQVLRIMYLPSGLALFLAIAAPWHILVQQANPEFSRFYFVREHFLRYLTKVHHHYKPFWFFLPILAGGLFPWSAFLLQAARHGMPSSWAARRERSETIFLLLWAVLIFLFFSASSSKLIPYLLPVLPPLALLIGRYLALSLENKGLRGMRLGFNLLLVLTSLIAAVLIAAPRRMPLIQELGLSLRFYAAALFLIAGAVTAWASWKRQRIPRALQAVAAGTAAFFFLAGTLVGPLDHHSIKPIALQLKKTILLPGDGIAAYHTYYQDLPVYLERTVSVVEWKGEMQFGTTVQDTSAWMLDESSFWRRWEGPGTMYLVTSRRNYDTLLRDSGRPYRIVIDTPENVVLANRKASP
jgi:4-amino-4-deoxy-L-arabinose transferase-like glycosyltransferase